MSEVDDECLYQCHEDYEYTQPERSVACKYCGQYPLYWQADYRGWRLYNRKGERHKCPAYKHPAS